MNTMNKTYLELVTFLTWEERLNYLYLGDNKIGESIFGGHRYLNQRLYNSPEWKKVRRDVIIRDNGCDMGIEDQPISNKSKIIIHHINPITIEDILDNNPKVLDMNNLISVSFNTHQYIHYGVEANRNEMRLTGDRFPNDTKLW